VPIRAELAANLGVFGPEELKDIVTAFEAVMKDMGLTDRADPATIMLASSRLSLPSKASLLPPRCAPASLRK
jgi:hypothetical protein